MAMTDIMAQYIIDDSALEGQNIDAFKIRFDSYTQVYRSTKKKARALSKDGQYMAAAALYKDAGDVLKKTANEIMQLEDNQASLAIGHIVATVQSICGVYGRNAATKAVGSAIVHGSAYVSNTAVSDTLFAMGDSLQIDSEISALFKKYVYPISISISAMTRLYASYRKDKRNTKNPKSTNPIRKEASNALLNMARQMYSYADHEKRKKSAADRKAKIRARKAAAKQKK